MKRKAAQMASEQEASKDKSGIQKAEPGGTSPMAKNRKAYKKSLDGKHKEAAEATDQKKPEAVGIASAEGRGSEVPVLPAEKSASASEAQEDLDAQYPTKAESAATADPFREEPGHPLEEGPVGGSSKKGEAAICNGASLGREDTGAVQAQQSPAESSPRNGAVSGEGGSGLQTLEDLEHKEDERFKSRPRPELEGVHLDLSKSNCEDLPAWYCLVPLETDQDDLKKASD